MFSGTNGIVKVNTTLAPETSITQGLFIEMFMTAELVFVVLMLAAEKSKDTFMAPIGIVSNDQEQTSPLLVVSPDPRHV